jgi:hypothetical protein
VGFQKVKRNGRTRVGNDDIQSIRHLFDLFYGLLVALLVVRDQLDDVDSRVLLRECIECVGGRWVSCGREEDSVGVAFEEGENEIVADASVGASDCQMGQPCI